MNFDNFLGTIQNKQDKTLYSHIIKQIESYEKPFGDWETEDIDRYLFDLHSTSVNALQRYYLLLSNLYKTINNKSKIKPSKAISEYLDFEKLRSTVITLDDYKAIKNELPILNDGELVNVRDKLIFELAWETLTSEEIRALKEKDIEEISNDLVIIHLPTRDININDPEIIEDIQTVRYREFSYIAVQHNGRVLRYTYKDSPYLIKPVSTRSDSKRQDVANLGIVFLQIMRKLSFDIVRKSRDHDGTEYDLNIDKISIESIRRSKIIYLLSMEKATIDIVRQMLNKKQQNDIVWLKRLAKKIYG